MTASLKRPLLVFATAGTMLVGLTIAGLPQAHGTGVEALVSVGSPQTTHPQNAQNEPALAVDPIDTSTLVAGSWRRLVFSNPELPAGVRVDAPVHAQLPRVVSPTSHRTALPCCPRR